VASRLTQSLALMRSAIWCIAALVSATSSHAAEPDGVDASEALINYRLADTDPRWGPKEICIDAYVPEHVPLLIERLRTSCALICRVPYIARANFRETRMDLGRLSRAGIWRGVPSTHCVRWRRMRVPQPSCALGRVEIHARLVGLFGHMTANS